jgi:hypothetical protein
MKSNDASNHIANSAFAPRAKAPNRSEKALTQTNRWWRITGATLLLLAATTTTTALQGQETLFGVPLKEGAPVKAQTTVKKEPAKKTISREATNPRNALPPKYVQYKMDQNSAEKQKMAKRICGKYWKAEHENIVYVFYPSGKAVEAGLCPAEGKWYLIGGDTIEVVLKDSYPVALYTFYDNDTVAVRKVLDQKYQVLTVVKK